MIFGFRSPAADMDRVDIFARHLRIGFSIGFGKGLLFVGERLILDIRPVLEWFGLGSLLECEREC